MKIYDRRSGEYLNVEQYGSGKLQFLYNNAFGRMLLWLAVSPLVSGIYGRINSLPSSAKKIPAFVNEYGIDTEEGLRSYIRDMLDRPMGNATLLDMTSE